MKSKIMSSIGWQIGVSILVIGGFMIAYLLIAALVGYVTLLKPVCSAGERALSTDGSRSLIPKGATDIITPTLDYPTCSATLSCPADGPQWAIHADGSALTNSCETPNCQCSAFQHCPAYVSTVFRQYGADARISLFQIIDPNAKVKSPNPLEPNSTPESKFKDPYDPPYVILPGSGDRCFLNSTTINMVWPAIKLGDSCIQGTLASLSTNPANYACVPSAFVNSSHVFNVDAYMNSYRT